MMVCVCVCVCWDQSASFGGKALASEVAFFQGSCVPVLVEVGSCVPVLVEV